MMVFFSTFLNNYFCNTPLAQMLRIRLLQLKRSFSGLPVLYWLIIATVVLYAFYGLSVKMNDYSFSIIVMFACPVLIASLHFVRRDHRFLNILSPYPWKIYLREYFTLLIPVLLLFVIHQYWSLILFSIFELLVFVGIIALVPVRSNITLTFAFVPVRITSLIPVPGFEWHGGYRRWGFQVLIFYLFAIGLSFLPFASLFLLAFLTFVIGGFYTHGESLAILNADNLEPSAFLKKKILQHSKFMSLFLLPALIIYLFQHPEHWYMVLIAWFVYMINIFYFITLKYALYRPDKKLTADTIWVGLLFAATLIPFLFPIPLIVSMRNYSLSKINLKIYLDDHS